MEQESELCSKLCIFSFILCYHKFLTKQRILHEQTGILREWKADPIDYNMTNNYMFRYILQSNEKVLRGLICALLHLNPEEIKMYVKDDEYLEETARSLYLANSDDIIREQCLAREDAERRARPLERDKNSC